jgi:hypothetical protein
MVEEFEAGRAEVLGVMKDSNEETIEAAEAEISRLQSASAFKASGRRSQETRRSTPPPFFRRRLI